MGGGEDLEKKTRRRENEEIKKGGRMDLEKRGKHCRSKGRGSQKKGASLGLIQGSAEKPEKPEGGIKRKQQVRGKRKKNLKGRYLRLKSGKRLGGDLRVDGGKEEFRESQKRKEHFRTGGEGSSGKEGRRLQEKRRPDGGKGKSPQSVWNKEAIKRNACEKEGLVEGGEVVM